MKNSTLFSLLFLVITSVSAFAWGEGGYLYEDMDVVTGNDDYVYIVTQKSADGWYEKLRIMDIKNRKILPECDVMHTSNYYFLTSANLKRHLLAYPSNVGFYVKDINNNQIIYNYNPSSSPNTYIPKFSRSGDTLLVYGNKKIIYFGVGDNGQIDSLFTWNLDSAQYSWYGDFSNYGEYIVYFNLDTIYLWNTITRKYQGKKLIQYINPDSKYKFSDDNSKIFFMNDDHHIRIFDFTKDSLTADIYSPGDLPNDFNISANGRFLITYSKYGGTVLDLDSIKNIISNDYSNYKIDYFSNDGKFLVASVNEMFTCPDVMDYGIGKYITLVAYKIDIHQDPLCNYPIGHIGSYGVKAILNSEGNYLCASVENYTLNQTVVDCALWNMKDSSFVKYLSLKKNPLAFTPDSKKLLSADGNMIIFHDIELDKATDSMSIDINKPNVIKFDKQHEIIVCSNDSLAAIYNYSTRKLIKIIDLPDSIAKIYKIKFLDNGNLALLSTNKKLINYDINSDKVNIDDFSEIIPQSSKIYDISRDGENLLVYGIRKFTMSSWNILSKSETYSYKFPVDYDPYLTEAYYLHGNFSFAYSRISNYLDQYSECDAINFVTRSKCNFEGAYGLIISPDNLHYTTTHCPGEYFYDEICPEILTGVGNEPFVQIDELHVYPNPATDNLTIRLPVNEAGTCNISIINMLGVEVFSNRSSEVGDIEVPVTNLPAGVYYILVKYCDKQKRVKFIKN